MKFLKIRKIYILFSTVVIFMLHLPFAFSKSNGLLKMPVSKNTVITGGTAMSAAAASMNFIYDSLKLNLKGLSSVAFENAVKGYQYLKTQGKIYNDNVLSIVDFSKPSTEKRLFIIDLKNCKILFNTYVAHGQKSGREYANQFSNRPESYQSSLGFYVTSDTYIGKNGFSMHLDGQEKGINDEANERAIVMHGAPYVSEDFIRSHGYLGRSWGCPAVPENLSKSIIEKIKNGSCLFIYGNDNKYLNYSKILNS